MLEAFAWNMAFSSTIFYILASIFVGHPFHGAKKILWLAINQAFFWYLWCKCNVKIFRDISLTFGAFVDLVLFNSANVSTSLATIVSFLYYPTENLYCNLSILGSFYLPLFYLSLKSVSCLQKKMKILVSGLKQKYLTYVEQASKFLKWIVNIQQRR